jgi:hypothetical protein
MFLTEIYCKGTSLHFPVSRCPVLLRGGTVGSGEGPLRTLVTPLSVAAAVAAPTRPTASPDRALNRRPAGRSRQIYEQGQISDYFPLTPDDSTLIETARGASNRLALALLLTWARAARQLVSDPTALPGNVIGFVAGQLGVDPDEFVGYRRRPATRTQHVAWVCRHLGVRPFSRAEEARLGVFIQATALRTGSSAALLDAADDWLTSEGVLRPCDLLVTQSLGSGTTPGWYRRCSTTG